MRKAGSFIFSGIVCVFLTACGPQGAAPQSEVGYDSQQAPAPQEEVPGRINDSRPGDFPYDRQAPVTQDNRAAKVEFLTRLRDADPQYQTIQRAMMNEQNELGLILNRSVNMDDIPKLMRAVLKQMAGQFPAEDLTVIAYAPSEPPIKIGTGRLDARTREMTYTPARPSQSF